jgi:hypothetical protein
LEWAKALPNFPFTPLQSPRLRAMSGHLTRGASSSLADPGVNTERSGLLARAADAAGNSADDLHCKPRGI